MPRDKDLKRIVRTRMTKTGESYTTARAHIASRTPSKTPTASAAAAAVAEPEIAPPASPPPEYARLAGMSDDTVKAKTGCDWAHWVYVLDQRGAAELSHGEIAAIVHGKYEIDGWWAQAVTVGYERIKGLRERGQRRSGEFEAGKSRTFPVPVEVLFDAWARKRTRRRWLTDADPEVRTASKPRSLRLGWDDGTVVALWFTAKGEEKSSVSVQHLKLPDRAAAESSKRCWGERLDALSRLLGGRAPRA